MRRRSLILFSVLPPLVAACAEPAASLGNDAGPIDSASEDLGQAPVDAALDAGIGELDAEVTDTAGPDGGGPTWGFVEDVYPMFNAVGCNTFACHGSMLAPGGVLLYMPDEQTAYDDMLERTSFREANVILRPGAPDESVLVTHGEGTLIQFQVITADQAALVRRWVADGAAFRRSPGGADAGVADGGSEPATCTLADARGMPALPGACLPRCARATWDQVIACRTAPDPASCQLEAMEADPTPAQLIDGVGDTLAIDCRQCVDWQTFSCIAESCPEEALRFQRCRSLTPNAPCDAESNAMFTCAAASPTFRPCQATRDPTCVAP